MTSQLPERPLSVAITGASGFIGSHLLTALSDACVVSVPLSRRPGIHQATNYVVVPDYLDVEHLSHALSGVVVLVHLAARAHQADEGNANAAYDVANVRSTLAVANACGRAGVRRMVFLSSIGVNGNRTYTRPFTEADVPAPTELYAQSKLVAERVLAEHLMTGDTDYVILRPPLVYGSGCPGNFERLLSIAIKAPFVPLGALRAPRRFVHVANLVDAIRVAATHPGVSRQTFLIGDARDLTVDEIVRVAAKAVGRPASTIWNVPPQLLALVARLSGHRASFDKLLAPLQIDTSKFSLVTGWIPPADPHDGIAEAARHLVSRASVSPFPVLSA